MKELSKNPLVFGMAVDNIMKSTVEILGGDGAPLMLQAMLVIGDGGLYQTGAVLTLVAGAHTFLAK